MGSFAPMIRCVPIRRGAPRANCRLRLHSVNLDGMPAREDILANLFEGVGLIPFRNAGILGRLAAKYLLHLPSPRVSILLVVEEALFCFILSGNSQGGFLDLRVPGGMIAGTVCGVFRNCVRALFVSIISPGE